MIQFSGTGVEDWSLESMLTQRKLFVLLTLTALLASSLGCAFLSGNAATETPTPAVTEDPHAVETQVSAAIGTAESGGRITLEFTEGQLTAAANEEIQNQGETRISDLLIHLDDGVMTISGRANQNGLELPLTIALKITADSLGKPHTEIVSGKLGPFSLPDNLLTQITTQLDEVLQSELDANAQDLFVESIGIDNGMITVVAQMR
jgi:hypothetical protein